MVQPIIFAFGRKFHKAEPTRVVKGNCGPIIHFKHHVMMFGVSLMFVHKLGCVRIINDETPAHAEMHEQSFAGA